jgi:hypothetical protein
MDEPVIEDQRLPAMESIEEHRETGLGMFLLVECS